MSLEATGGVMNVYSIAIEYVPILIKGDSHLELNISLGLIDAYLSSVTSANPYARERCTFI